MKSNGLPQDGNNFWEFVITVMNFCFHKEGEIFFLLLLFGKARFLWTLLHITQSINTYIDPVCPHHLTLRYCGCKTYLLHRRAELEAAPGSICLMRNWTLDNNEPLAVPTYVSGVISDCALNERKLWTCFWSSRLFCTKNIIYECFSHNSPSFTYRVVTL